MIHVGFKVMKDGVSVGVLKQWRRCETALRLWPTSLGLRAESAGRVPGQSQQQRSGCGTVIRRVLQVVQSAKIKKNPWISQNSTVLHKCFGILFKLNICMSMTHVDMALHPMGVYKVFIWMSLYLSSSRIFTTSLRTSSQFTSSLHLYKGTRATMATNNATMCCPLWSEAPSWLCPHWAGNAGTHHKCCCMRDPFWLNGLPGNETKIERVEMQKTKSFDENTMQNEKLPGPLSAGPHGARAFLAVRVTTLNVCATNMTLAWTGEHAGRRDAFFSGQNAADTSWANYQRHSMTIRWYLPHFCLTSA